MVFYNFKVFQKILNFKIDAFEIRQPTVFPRILLTSQNSNFAIEKSLSALDFLTL